MPCPPPEDLPSPMIESASSMSLSLQADSLPTESSGKPFGFPMFVKITDFDGFHTVLSHFTYVVIWKPFTCVHTVDYLSEFFRVSFILQVKT